MNDTSIINTDRPNIELDSLAGLPSQHFQKVSVYIDGFNLYHSIKDIKEVHINHKPINTIQDYQKISWVNLKNLTEKYVRKIRNSQLQEIYFFTAFPKHRPTDQQERHADYIKVLQGFCNIKIVNGKFTTYFDHTNGKNATSEKQTDTNLAVQVMYDILLKNIDVAIVLSNDSDIIPIINKTKECGYGRIHILTPPTIKYIKQDRKGNNIIQQTCNLSNDIKIAQQNSFRVIDRVSCKELLDNLLPNEVIIQNGTIIKNPYI